jgi:DNA polymerase I-like protein with 3'-5' exonuclease and polymerase domains
MHPEDGWGALSSLEDNMSLALDFESTWEAGRDINSLGVFGYLKHPKTEIYLVSMYGEGVEYCGPLEQAPWDRISGKHWISHNRSFDKAVHTVAIKRGQIPEWCQPSDWDCTADLCAYVQAPRALGKAMPVLCGVTLDKAVRDKTRGLRWADMTPEFRQEVVEYGLDDSRACWLLWDQYNHLWPDWERDLSKHTTLMTSRGIGIDADKVEHGVEVLKQAMHAAELEIPWIDEDTGPAARKALAEACRAAGVPPPRSTAKTSPEFDAWLEEYGERVPFVAALQDWRQTKRLLDVFTAFRDRSIDGVLPYSLKYGGASHTMRWSGDSGLNLQNLARSPLKSRYAKEAVYSRECLMAPPGFVFVGADLAQIEPRVVMWLSGDEAAMDMVRGGMCVYEAHARQYEGYTDPRPLKVVAETDPKAKALRQFCKAVHLGLGYGMGAGRFMDTAKAQAGVELGAVEAERVVKAFRDGHPGITALWRKVGYAVCRSGKSEIELPSGRRIRYFDTYNDGTDWRTRVERGGPAYKIHGPKVTENLTQAMARDVLALNILQAERAGLPVVLHVHDEIVTCVPEGDAEEAKRELVRIMSTPPEWAPDLPVGVEATISRRYWK